MGKIVILEGSIRKGGNTDLLAKSFADGASARHTVEIVSVGDYEVKPCEGCNACFVRENNACCIADDMAKIYATLKDADMLVLASPLYFYGISARLKAIIDRLHNPIRNTFPIKKMALLMVGAADLPEMFDAVKLQYELSLRFFHLEDAGIVCVPGVNKAGEIKGNAAIMKAFMLGASIEEF